MVLVLPTAEQLRDEQSDTGSGDTHGAVKLNDSAWCIKLKDSSWSVKFKDYSNLDPADVHGA